MSEPQAVTLVFLTPMREDGRRLISYAQRPAPEHICADLHELVPADAMFYGKPARAWPSGVYRVEGDRLVPDEEGHEGA